MTYAPNSTKWHDGLNGPLNPFGESPPPHDPKDDEIPGYVGAPSLHMFRAYGLEANLSQVKRFGAYHTLTEGVFLPAGTLLPKGANFAMQSTVDFGIHLPIGTKVPGGFLLPVSVVKKDKDADKPSFEDNPFCLIQ